MITVNLPGSGIHFAAENVILLPTSYSDTVDIMNGSHTLTLPSQLTACPGPDKIGLTNVMLYNNKGLNVDETASSVTCQIADIEDGFSVTRVD